MTTDQEKPDQTQAAPDQAQPDQDDGPKVTLAGLPPLGPEGKEMVRIALERYPVLDPLGAELFVRAWQNGSIDEKGQLINKEAEPASETPVASD